MKNVNRWGLLMVVCAGWACTKPQVELNLWQKAQVPNAAEITSLWMLDDSTGYATGGLSWEVGYLYSTRDGGLRWTQDTVVRHKMECVMADSAGHVYAVGQSGICWERPPGSGWIKYREDYRWHHSCFMTGADKGLIVSGESFGEGQVRVFGPEFFWQQDTILEFPNQLQSVWATDAQHWHACGLGWVIRSDDGGYSWERARVSDDFFSDVHFPDAQTGYICGHSGTILKTTDGGKQWQVIRKGGSIRPRLRRFNAIWFETPEKGWVAGANGLLWRTTDGGAHWSEIKEAPTNVDFAEVFVRNGRGWVCGTEGSIFVFEE